MPSTSSSSAPTGSSSMQSRRLPGVTSSHQYGRQSAADGPSHHGGAGDRRREPQGSLNELSQMVNNKFHRAVDIIQSLPKSGPITTSYEEKLMLYSLYKQATEGPVKTPRPGVFDLLGRAKWDSWKKREKLTKFQSQEAYVETLLSILKNFNDKPQAVELIRELRDYGKDTISRQEDYEDVTSSSSIRSASPQPETSGSRRSYHSAQPALPASSSISSRLGQPTRYEEDEYLDEGEETPRKIRSHHENIRPHQTQRGQYQAEYSDEEYDESGSEEAYEEEYQRHPDKGRHRTSQPQAQGRQRYQPVPLVQPRFAGPSPYQHPAQYPAPIDSQLPVNLPPAIPNAPSNMLAHQSSSSMILPVRRDDRPPAPPSAVPSINTLPPGLVSQQRSAPLSTGPSALSASQTRPGPPSPSLDRALDSIQTSLAALHERLNLIESSQSRISRSTSPALAWISDSPIFQFLRLLFDRILVMLRLRQASSSAVTTLNGVRTSMISLLGRAILSLLANVRDLSRDAVAVVFLVTAVASLRNSNGDWRNVLRAWARIIAIASGVGFARENGFLEALGNQR